MCLSFLYISITYVSFVCNYSYYNNFFFENYLTLAMSWMWLAFVIMCSKFVSLKFKSVQNSMSKLILLFARMELTRRKSYLSIYEFGSAIKNAVIISESFRHFHLIFMFVQKRSEMMFLKSFLTSSSSNNSLISSCKLYLIISRSLTNACVAI